MGKLAKTKNKTTKEHNTNTKRPTYWTLVVEVIQ